MAERKVIKRALISVSDKSRLVEIGEALIEKNIEIIATDSTANALAAAGIKVTEISSYTGFPEIMGGRVKTLHPKIHSGILADQNNPEHIAAIKDLNIGTIDLLIVNLYPFQEKIMSGITYEECIEQIDIGGPTMLRAGAKNHESVAVISTPQQYDDLLRALNNGGFTLSERRELAIYSFRTTAEYEIAIANWFEKDTEFPNWFATSWRRKGNLRYGENPHQRAAIYSSPFPGIVSAEQLHGKEMSFNNYADADAAQRAVLDHSQPAVSIIKHVNPCAIATGNSISDAFAKAYSSDPISIFGSVIAANRKIDVVMAKALSEIFIEVLVAPGFDSDALEVLIKKPNIRILKSAVEKNEQMEARSLSGGLLLQQSDLVDAPGDLAQNWQQVSGDKVSDSVLADLQFAWRAIRAVKSNAILLAKDGASVGIGMGQVNRIDSAKLAVNRAGAQAKNSVAASDAFFPFADGLEILINAGIAAVVQPGGSIRDEEVIAAAKAKNLPMFFTGVRHFAHA